MTTFTDAEIIAFLDESLSPERSTELESALKSDLPLRERFLAKIGQQAAGLHTIGSIWQRMKLTCPTRQELQDFLQDKLEPNLENYVRFHLIQIGCRYCQANCADLLNEQDLSAGKEERQTRFFQTSAGHLSHKRDANL